MSWPRPNGTQWPSPDVLPGWSGPPLCPIVGGLDTSTMTATEITRRRVILGNPKHPEYPRWAAHAAFSQLITQERRAVELRRYLRAISPDLPLPKDASGWLVGTGWMIKAKRFVIKAGGINWAYKPKCRWQPFGGSA